MKANFIAQFTKGDKITVPTNVRRLLKLTYGDLLKVTVERAEDG